MADLANLVLAVDSTQVPKGTAALNDLAAAGARAEASTTGLSTGFKGAGAQAAEMASAAQLSARAAMDQAAGFRVASDAARVNTMALRESLVVTRELMRGNFTRLPGSLMLLGQGVGAQGGIGNFLSAISQQLGLIKQVQNAELAEAAAAAASAAAGVEAAARRAAANVMAADTEIALAEAQLRVTEGTTAEAVAQARLAAAHEAVGAAAAEAAVAENALAAAMGRSAETQAASSAATRTVIGGAGVGLLGIATVAGIAYGAIKEFQDQVKDSGALDKYAESLNLTDAQVKKLGGSITYLKDGTREISDLTVTFGDVMAGVWQQVTANSQGAFGNMKSAAGTAFDGILGFWNKASAALSAGLWTLGDIAKDVFQFIGQQIGKSFYDGVNKAVDALNSLNARIPKWAGGGDPNLIPHLKGDPTVGTLGGLGATIRGQADANYAAALAANNAAYAGVRSGALQSARNRLQSLSDSNRPKKGRKPKKPPKQPVDHANDTIARLDEQILSAKISLTKDATEEAALKVQQLRVERDKTIADAQSLLNQHKITGAEFDTIKLKAQELDNLKEKAVLNARDIKLLEQDQTARDQLFGFQTDALKAADAAASSQAERRTIELQMLDIAYEQKKYDLQITEEKARIAGATAAQLKLIQDQIDHLPTQKAFDQAGVVSRTQDPLRQWLDKIPHDAAMITEALQGIETHGFDQLAQGIAGVVTGTESLGKAFKDVAQSIISDIIQMTVRMLIFRAITGLFGGGGSFSNVNVGSGTLSQGFANIPHFAGGGSMIIGGASGIDRNLLSLNGSPVAMVGQGETLAVFPSGKAVNSNTPQHVEVFVHVATDENFNASVAQMAGQVVVQAAPTIVKSAVQATATTFTRKTLNGRR